MCVGESWIFALCEKPCGVSTNSRSPLPASTVFAWPHTGLSRINSPFWSVYPTAPVDYNALLDFSRWPLGFTESPEKTSWITCRFLSIFIIHFASFNGCKGYFFCIPFFFLLLVCSQGQRKTKNKQQYWTVLIKDLNNFLTLQNFTLHAI